MNNHRNNRLWRLAVVALILVVLSIAVSGCSTKLIVSGTVYEWVDAPADTDGEVYVDMAAPTDRIIEPLDNVSLASFGAVTTENGTFRGGAGFFPRRVIRFVKIEKEGYHTIEGEWQYEELRHSFVIFMVRQ